MYTGQRSNVIAIAVFLIFKLVGDRYFPKGTIVYRESDIGNAMYFINSGTISVEASGSVVKRGPGDFFGEGTAA